MAWARENGYVVFTHDLDFGTLLALTRDAGPSVIQVRTHEQTMKRIQYLVRISRDPHSNWGASVPTCRAVSRPARPSTAPCAASSRP